MILSIHLKKNYFCVLLCVNISSIVIFDSPMGKNRCIPLIISSALLISCGVSKDLKMIQSYQDNKDVESLIRSISDLPNYRSTVEYTLYNDVDYDTYSYGSLKKFSELANSDVEISIFFDSLLIDRQTRTIDSLSTLGIEDVADFYREKGREHDYLHDILIDSYFSDVEGMDYQSMKVLNNAFAETDLYPLVNNPYNVLRDHLLAEIFSVWDPYFKTEAQMLDDIEDVVREESRVYIESGLSSIMEAVLAKNDRTFIKKLFKRKSIDSYTFEEYVNEVINQTFDPKVIEEITTSRMTEYLESCSRMRSSFFNEYFDENNYSGLTIDSAPLASFLDWRIGRNDVGRMQNIKDTGTALTVGSIALGFIPGIGALAFAADVADFAYGMRQDSKERKAIQDISDTIYNDSYASVESYLSRVFGGIRESRKTTEEAIRTIFEQDF